MAASQNGVQDIRSTYRQDIDGLRAIAVISVVLFHAGVSLVSGGYVGVDVFFVISGYLIGAHIYRDVFAGRFSIAEFYRRRTKRILPALFVLLTCCYVVALLLLSPQDILLFSHVAVASIFSLSNVLAWHRASNYFASDMFQNPLLMTWTLGVEEQFYIFFPLLMLSMQRAKWQKSAATIRWRRYFVIMLVLSLISFSMSLTEIPRDQTAAFYLIVFRAWELGVGVLMAIYEAKPKELGTDGASYGGSGFANLRSLIGLALIGYAVFFYKSATLFPGKHALAPVLGAAFVLSAPTAWINRYILSSPPFRWIGLLSYSWYLWHWPLLSFASSVSAGPLTKRASLGLVTVAMGVAWVSWRFIEQPFRRSKQNAGPLLWRYGAVGAVLAGVGIVFSMLHGLPHRYPDVQAFDAKVMPFRACGPQGMLTDQDRCIPKKDGKPTVVLWGDSHAYSLANVVERQVTSKGMRSVILTQLGCPPVLRMAEILNGKIDEGCLRFNKDALEFVKSDATITTVVLSGFWARPEVLTDQIDWFARPGQQITELNDSLSEANLEYGLNAMVVALQAAGKRVILLQDEPSLRLDPKRGFESNMIPARRWILRNLLRQRGEATVASANEIFVEQDERARKIVAKIAEEDGVEIFDLSQQLCHEGECMYVADGQLLYWDPSHLTEDGAVIALRGLPLPVSANGS